MAINNYFDNTDINIYFHMKNHYRRLRSAKSTIDNSFPQSFIQSYATPPGSARSLKNNDFRERNTQNFPQTINASTVKKRNCVTSGSGTSETSINTINIPPRSKSSRSLSAISSKMQCITRSECLSSTNRKSVYGVTKTKKKKKVVRKMNNFETVDKIENLMDERPLKNDEIIDTDQSMTLKQTEDKVNVKQSRVHEHEYLQFLLRITEDIIINNLYTNEDIERVFQTHVEANKNHLEVEKMEAQLTRLCVELGIPYKRHENSASSLDCYNQFFDPYICSNDQALDDCECATKRTLNVGANEIETDTNKENKEKSSEAYLHKMFDMIAARYSESKLSNYTGSCNSLKTLTGSVHQPSEQTVHNSESIDIFKCFENLKMTGEGSRIHIFEQDITVNINESTSYNNDSDLTPKEKLGCVEEDILFNKYNGNLTEEDDYINESDNTPKNISTNETERESEADSYVTQNISEETKTRFDQNDPDQILNVVDKLQEDLESNKLDNDKVQEDLKSNKLDNDKNSELEQLSCIFENTEREDISFLMKCDDVKPIEDRTELIKDILCNAAVQTSNDSLTSADNVTKIIERNDQCVQIEVTHSDKECNTSINLKDYSQSDYVLLNGPIYVLKAVLNSEDKLVIYDKDKVENQMRPEKLYEDDVKSSQHRDSIPTYQTQLKLDCPSCSEVDLAKLLNSDYDLMPQRDSDTSDKYHHLLVDASTSISNVEFSNSVGNILTNPDALLLTDKYELITQEAEDGFVPEMDPSKYAVEKNDLELQKRLSASCGYELRKHSSSLGPFVKTEALQRGRVPGLEVSVRDQELFSQSILRGGDHISKDVSESGEVVLAGPCTDDEQSTYRSDTERNSSISSPNRSHILGKRKLVHPS